MPQGSNDVKLFGIINLSKYSDNVLFIICVIGVFSCYFIYGIAQENIFNIWRREGTPCGWALTFLQYSFYTIFTYFQRHIVYSSALSSSLPSSINKSNSYNLLKRVAPISSYVMLAACSVGTVGLSNASCDFLTYPTQVLFKSSKILPVMLMGTIILKKKHHTIEYVCVVAITLGLLMLNISKSSRGHGSTNEDTTFGLILICTALFADALIGNVQEKVFNQYKPTASESIFYTKLFGTFISFVITLINGQMNCLTIIFFSSRMAFYIIMFCTFGVIGENFIMIMVKRFGALTTVTTTSVRKAVTIIFSFIIFPKPINSVYICGVIFIFSGLGLNIWIKQQGDKEIKVCGMTLKDGVKDNKKKRRKDFNIDFNSRSLLNGSRHRDESNAEMV